MKYASNKTSYLYTDAHFFGYIGVQYEIVYCTARRWFAVK